LEGAHDEEVLVVNVLRAGGGESLKCLTDEEGFLARRERMEFERRKKIEVGEYVAECLMEEAGIIRGNSWMRRKWWMRKKGAGKK
jgi:hypothetical protein